ncbi:MAG: serine hydrolase domain-containing protein [Bacillota bacterium]
MRSFPAKEFEEFARSVMAEHKIPGVAVSVIDRGEVIYKNGFGYRDQERGLPVTPETIFGVASVTKSFTSLAIMQLAESGKLSVHDPVQKYIPGFDLPGSGGEAVTIHHFMTHTSSLPPLPTLGWSIRGNTKPDEDAAASKAKSKATKAGTDKRRAAGADKEPAPQPINTYDELTGYIRNGDFELLGKPGEYCSYSNDGYALLGPIIEAVSGEEYEDYMRNHILNPLMMGRSNFDISWLLRRGNTTTLYYKDEDQNIKHSPNWQVAPPFVPCGWLKSTVMDLANYLSMHAGGGVFGARRILSADGIATMRAKHCAYSRDRFYGYGFSNLSGYHGATLVEHSGGLKGVASNIGYVPEEKIGVAVLTNLSGAPSGKLWLGAINLLLGLPVDSVRSEYKKEPWGESELQPRTGKFKSGEGGEVTITSEDGRLMASVAKEKHEILRDSAEFGVVTMNGLDSEVRFHLGADGKVWAIGWGGRIIRKTGDA